MNENDLNRLRHMLDMAKTARQFVAQETRESLERDRKLQFAVVKVLEIVGEAASKVSADTLHATSKHPLVSHHWNAKYPRPCL
jgi:uncharacterized protein with HEPN domain